MSKIQLKTLEKKISDIEIESLAQQYKFVKRSGGATGKSFLMSFFFVVQLKVISLQNWSTELGLYLGKTFSKQALSQKFYDRHLDWLKQVINKVIEDKVDRIVEDVSLFSSFSNVYLRDSTCLNLDKSLALEFPSSSNQYGCYATARLQVIYELKQRQFNYFDLQAYRDSDAKQAPKIIETAQKGDLVLQDLAYSALAELKRMNKAGIYFVSKFNVNVQVFDYQTGKPIDLIKKLKKNGYIDQWVYIGVEHKVALRIVATKLAQQLADTKRRKAKTNRDSRINYTQNYMFLLGWNIVVTNVANHIWKTSQVGKAYRIRWHIEIIFKSWKSSLKFQEIVAQKMSPNKCRIIIYLLLLYALLLVHHFYRFCLQKVKEVRQDVSLSIIKVYAFARQLGTRLMTLNWNDLIELVIQKCTYDKRNDRQNFEQMLQSY